MLTLDSKQTLLIGIYAWYQQEKFQPLVLNAEELGLSRETYQWALKKLTNEHLVCTGLLDDGWGRVENFYFPNPEGIRYVEAMFGIPAFDSGARKLSLLAGRLDETANPQLVQFVQFQSGRILG